MNTGNRGLGGTDFSLCLPRRGKVVVSFGNNHRLKPVLPRPPLPKHWNSAFAGMTTSCPLRGNGRQDCPTRQALTAKIRLGREARVETNADTARTRSESKAEGRLPYQKPGPALRPASRSHHDDLALSLGTPRTPSCRAWYASRRKASFFRRYDSPCNRSDSPSRPDISFSSIRNGPAR